MKLPGLVAGKQGRKKKAKAPGGVIDAPPAALGGYKPPSPLERLQGSVKYASQDAVMAHPAVQRLHRGIHAKMMAAARGVGFNGPGIRNVKGV